MIWPAWTKAALVAVAALVVLLLLWVYWPAPGPSPAEDALKKQNEALIEQNKQLAADAAAKTEEAQQLREDANAEVEKIPALRSRRRAARRDDTARRDALAQTPDELAVDALRAQHIRTRAAVRAVRAEPAAEGNAGQPHPR